MHTLVRRFIKTGIAFLAAGLALGLWMLVRRELAGVWPHPYLVSAHAHAVLAGLVMFLIPGVALWLFPRAEKGDTRYQPQRVEAAYWIRSSAGSSVPAWCGWAWA
jgi:heme/copper-type cytochrome/quinol oxidase subunit 1